MAIVGCDVGQSSADAAVQLAPQRLHSRVASGGLCIDAFLGTVSDDKFARLANHDMPSLHGCVREVTHEFLQPHVITTVR